MTWAEIKSQMLNQLSCPDAPEFKTKFFNILFYIWERETESEQGSGREMETESEAGSRLWATSTEPDTGLEPTSSEITTWAEVRCSTDRAIEVPWSFFNIKINVLGSFRQWRKVVMHPLVHQQTCSHNLLYFKSWETETYSTLNQNDKVDIMVPSIIKMNQMNPTSHIQ